MLRKYLGRKVEEVIKDLLNLASESDGLIAKEKARYASASELIKRDSANRVLFIKALVRHIAQLTRLLNWLNENGFRKIPDVAPNATSTNLSLSTRVFLFIDAVYHSTGSYVDFFKEQPHCALAPLDISFIELHNTYLEFAHNVLIEPTQLNIDKITAIKDSKTDNPILFPKAAPVVVLLLTDVANKMLTVLALSNQQRHEFS